MGRDEGEAAAAALMDELWFGQYAGYRVEALSGGTRQKLNLALALMHDPHCCATAGAKSYEAHRRLR